MHGQHPEPMKGPCIGFGKVPGLLLGNDDFFGAVPLPWPTEPYFAVAVGHCNGIVQAFTLEQMH